MTTQTTNKPDVIQSILDKRYIPEGYYLSQSECPTQVYYKEANGKFYSLGFLGRAINSTFNYVWSTAEAREQHLNKFFRQKNEYELRKATRRAEQKAKIAEGHKLVVGDILVSSWGYDQTNIDYYQVTDLIGKTMVEVRQIRAEVVGTSGYYDKLMPIKDSFNTPRFEGDTWRCETLRKKVSPGGSSISISSYASAYKWDGRAEEQTALGFGH